MLADIHEHRALLDAALSFLRGYFFHTQQHNRVSQAECASRQGAVAYPAPMPLPEGVTVVDLRPPELRLAQPLEQLTTLPVVAVTLDQIEDGAHGLTRDDRAIAGDL